MNRISLWVLFGLVAVLSRPTLARVYRYRRERLPVPAGPLFQALLGLAAVLTAGLALLVPEPLIGPVLTVGALLVICGQAFVRYLRPE